MAIFIIITVFSSFYFGDKVDAQGPKNKIGVVLSSHDVKNIDSGVDDIRFKLKREEDEKARQLAEKKAKAKAEEEAAAKEREKERQKKIEEMKRVRKMSLSELNNNGYIKKLCDNYGMSKKWFDRISHTESSYGVYTPGSSYNAWGWGGYKMGSNWYDSSEEFIRSFVNKYGSSPSRSDMRMYCPSGAYDKYF